MSVYEFVAKTRTESGTAAARRARLNGLVPGVVYGAGKPEQMLYFQHKEVVKTMEDAAVFSQIVQLDCDGKKEMVVLKEVQSHPYKPLVTHIDMLRIKAKEKLTISVPVRVVGADLAPGVKKDKGIVSHLMNEVEVKCLPADLPESLELDMSELEVEQALHLSDIKVPKGVEIVALSLGEDHDLPVLSIHKPKIAADDTAEEETTDAEETSEA